MELIQTSLWMGWLDLGICRSWRGCLQCDSSCWHESSQELSCPFVVVHHGHKSHWSGDYESWEVVCTKCVQTPACRGELLVGFLLKCSFRSRGKLPILLLIGFNRSQDDSILRLSQKCESTVSVKCSENWCFFQFCFSSTINLFFGW